MNKSVKIFLFVLFALSSAFSFAQNPCNDKLNYAKQLFESGQIEQIPDILDSCLENGFGKSEENQAYRLLIQTYLFDYNRDKALEVMFWFLKKYPEYTFTASDPLEIKEVFDAYKIQPNWGFGIYGGTTLSQVNSLQNFSVLNLNNLNSAYKQKLGSNIGLFIEKYMGPHFALSLGFNFKTVNFQNDEISSNNQTSVTLKESTSWYSSPLSFSYVFGKGRVAPFIFCGTDFEILLKAKGDFLLRINQNNNSIISQSGSSDIKASRKQFNCSAFGGLGLRYKIPKGYLKLWMGYSYAFTDYVNSSNRYQNINNIMKYGYLDDNMQRNQFTIAFTYSRILYKIKIKANHAADQ
jgi:hypothetical protein